MIKGRQEKESLFFHNSNGEWGKDKSQVSCLN
jgi:hypothetical protein